MAPSRRVWILLCIAALTLGAILVWRWAPESEQATVLTEKPLPVSRNVHWELSVRNLSDRALHNTEILSFLPLPNTWQQSLAVVSGSHPIEQELNFPDQSIGRVALATIPPYGQRNIRFEAQLVMATSFDNIEPGRLEPLLAPEALIESDHERIVELAQQLDRADDASTIQAIYDWLVAEVAYSGFDPVDRGALYALRNRTGDCTEYGALAVALARANGLPARLVSGYMMTENGRLSAFGFHAWAEIRADGRWWIVDAQERQLDPAPQDYLATHYGTRDSRQYAWERFYSPESSVAIEMR